MCIVIDLDVVCLICILPSKDMHPIFTADGDDSELQVAQKITILSELKIDQNNQTLPSKICAQCLQDLKAAWRFRKNCQAAVTIFRTIVKLDDVQPEYIASEELAVQEIKETNASQLQSKIVDNKAEEDKRPSESSILEKVAGEEEFLYNNDKVGSTLYEELGPHNYMENEDNDAHEFQTLEEADKNDEDQNEELDDDEDTLVEYYLCEDGTTDETTIKDDNKIPIKINIEETHAKAKTQDIEEKMTNQTKCAEKTNKPTLRGRPKRQIVLPKEVDSNTNAQKIAKGTIVVDSTNSSEEATQPQVRQVKTRKRKLLSPETKIPKICEICGNSYRFQHALNAHMRRHYNDKPFPCEFCDKAFVSNVELRRHMRVHTGQKPYACQYCERRFSDFGSRIKHERTHTGERPYHCKTCGKSFAYAHVLSVHVRTHTGEKRFRCEYCSKGFTKKAYLISHVNQHHSGPHSFQVVIEDSTDKSENHLKSDTLEECVYTTEFVNEEEIDEVEEYDDSNQGPDKIIITKSLMEPKIEVDDDVEIQENEEHPEEFTIRLR